MYSKYYVNALVKYYLAIMLVLKQNKGILEKRNDLLNESEKDLLIRILYLKN